MTFSPSSSIGDFRSAKRQSRLQGDQPPLRSGDGHLTRLTLERLRALSRRQERNSTDIRALRAALVRFRVGKGVRVQSRSGDVVIVFNGEIYNFLELRSRLEALGVVFRTTSDTEVILEGYLRWGHDVLPLLRGMFAFAIWDRRDGSTWLVRDRLGIKPLFVAHVPGGLAFSSEIKGLFALGIPRTIARGAIDRYLTYLYVPGPETAFEGVREVLPAHELRVDPGGGRARLLAWSRQPRAEARGLASSRSPRGPSSPVRRARASRLSVSAPRGTWRRAARGRRSRRHGRWSGGRAHETRSR
jgi:hypothetical protein